MEGLNLTLILLTVFIFFVILLVRREITERSGSLYKIIKIRKGVLLLFFFNNHFLQFYFYFELSLIPVFFIILGWGYQPERLDAGIWIFLYTLVSAIPLLFFLLVFIKNFQLTGFTVLNICFLRTRFSEGQRFWVLLLILGFLVKLPIYFFHIWLPRAHVEAPLIGSVLLAAILLKLGGFGLYKFLRVLRSLYLLLLLKRGALLGGACARLICLYEKDIKKLIAYSSVRHISFILGGILIKREFGLIGGGLFMLAHGLRSSFLFIGAFFIYSVTNSRSLILNFGFLRYWPLFRGLWFVANLAGIRAPPTVNFFREIFCLFGLFNRNLLIFLPVRGIMLISVGYSIILYSTRQYGQARKCKRLQFTEIKILVGFLHVYIIFSFSWVLRLL